MAKKIIFICQITERILKVIKCVLDNKSKREFAGLEIETIAPDLDDKGLSERLNQVFKKLEYNNNPVIISLPRHQATCRFLKLPTYQPQEIEKIVDLQACRYLPYPANELITGYQVMQTNKEGYADLNLVIAHKDVIERYIKIFEGLKPTKITIALSSYGLCSLFNLIKPKEIGPVMLVDINTQEVELVVIYDKKVYFSRSFKLTELQPNWEDLFIDEINKTQDAYIKEIANKALTKVIIIGTKNISQRYLDILNKQMTLPVEVLSYTDKINLSENVLKSILNSSSSPASVIGLGLEEMTASLNLLPQEIKEKSRKVSRRKELWRLTLFIWSIILIWAVAIAKHLDNKSVYLKQLKTELNKVAKEAKPLEEIEKRFKVLGSRSQKKLLSLEVLYELHQIIPAQISLTNFIYEEDKQVVLRGQTQEINSVNMFFLQLQKSQIFKNLNITLKFATTRKTQLTETVDFEIVCQKR